MHSHPSMTMQLSLRLILLYNNGIVSFRSAPAGAPTEGGAPNQPPNLTSNRRLQQTQAQVDEVSLPPILLSKFTHSEHDATVNRKTLVICYPLRQT